MSVFRFKQFSVTQAESAMKVGTDAMLLGSLVMADRPDQILDIGSGTGVISLMMAQRFAEANICGIELDDASANESRENFQNSPWSDRLSIVSSDLLEFKFKQKFDLIVSNPPYYQSRLENQDARKSQARHEAALPMDAMLKKVRTLLNDDGSFWVIIPAEISTIWMGTAETLGFQCIGRKDVYGKKGGTIKRVILEFGLSKINIDRQEVILTSEDIITIRDVDNSYTDQYIELTKEFHFNKLN